MHTRRVWWLGFLVLAAPACGGSSGGAAPFTPTTPVTDPCSMLALADVQTLLPGAPAGTPMAPDDNADIWLRGCAWQANGMAVTLIVEGPLTSNGDLVLGLEVEPSTNAQATAVSGVGDKAVYLVNPGLDQVLNARKGSDLVSVAASGFTPEVPEAGLQPLVVEALGKI